jgi:OOP family OmpA-OmpF porin
MKTILFLALFISSLVSNELLVTFDSNSYKINNTQKEKLEKYVDFLFTNYDLSINLEGHTDSIGSDNENMKLSIKRAETVKAYFLNEGIIESRINTIACGEIRPEVSNKTKENRQKNRRVVAKTFVTFE